jgi:nitrite reductase (NO-forming)
VGAVRKLATVVIVGLVALSTLMVVYLAAEPTRRDDETSEQNAVSIERGTSLYITYCLQCHGPAGLGQAEQVEPRRTGGILNQNAIMNEEQLAGQRAIYQSDDPVQQGIAEDFIRYRIIYGVPAEQFTANFDGQILMPAFGNDLNVQEINDLVYLIMHGDWNYVYNTAVHETGLAVAQEECLATPGANAEECEAIDHADPAYPTPPAPAGAPDTASEAAEGQGTPETAPEQDPGTDMETETEPDVDDESTDSEGEGAAPGEGEGGGAGIEIEAQDPAAFSETELTVKPGDTITMTNTGFLQHDFTIDELGIHEVTAGNGDSVTITIPEDAEAGEYEFYCSVPGHRESGMVGTLTVEAP